MPFVGLFALDATHGWLIAGVRGATRRWSSGVSRPSWRQARETWQTGSEGCGSADKSLRFLVPRA